MISTFDALVLALRGLDRDIGVYPAAVQGYHDQRDYTERTGYQNGWNAAVMQYGMSLERIIAEARAGLSEDLLLLTAADIGTPQADGGFLVHCPDTWAWATSDAELATPADVPDVARLFRAWGFAGVLYWVTQKRPGLQSEFKDINRFVAFVAREEALIQAEPNSVRRAYQDVPKED